MEQLCLLQAAVPHREHLRPGLFGRERVVDRTLGERETVLRAREGLDFVFDIGLRQQLVEIARDVGRYAAVGFGEGVIELTLDAVEKKMRRILLVGDNADAIERGGRLDAMRVERRGVGDVLAAHAITDTADGARLALVLRVEESEE